MAAGSIQLASINCTTVENLTRKTKVWYLAVRVPNSYQPPFDDSSREVPNSINLRTVTYPLPQWIPTSTGSPVGPDAPTTPNSPVSKRTTPAPRTFVVLTSRPGDNPWDLGSLGNIKQVLGFRLWDWLLPLKYSPCCSHESQESAYALGPVVERMRKEAGLSYIPQRADKSLRSARRKSGRASAGARERHPGASTPSREEARRPRRERRKRSRSRRTNHDRSDVIR